MKKLVFVIAAVLLVASVVWVGFYIHSRAESGQPHPTSALPATLAATSPYGFTVAVGIDDNLIARYKQLGMYWVRLQLPWDHIETSPGVYTWALLDQQVQLANKNGLKVSYVLQGAPAWHLTQTCPSNYQPFLPGASDMQAFADAVSKRYSGEPGSQGYIDSYEIGNEEYTSFNKVKKDPAANDACRTADRYVPVLRDTYQTIKSNSPHALVGMFGSAWQSIAGTRTFYQRMYELGAKPYFDFANFHYYNGNNSTEGDPTKPVPKQPDYPTFQERWQTIESVMRANGDGAKPIWVTETGWHVTGRQGHPNSLAVSPAQQATYMQDELNSAYQSGVIKKFFWYTINTADSLYHDHSADIYPDYPSDNTPLPAYQTYQTFIAEHPTW